jgi:hypothetical protein
MATYGELCSRSGTIVIMRLTIRIQAFPSTDHVRSHGHFEPESCFFDCRPLGSRFGQLGHNIRPPFFIPGIHDVDSDRSDLQDSSDYEQLVAICELELLVKA